MRFALGGLVAVLLLIPRPSGAQTGAPESDESRIFVDVNLFGTTNSMASSREFTSLFVKFGEHGSFRATYPKPSRANRFPLVDLGGGFMLTRSLGIGISYSRTAHEDLVDLAATIPHPTFFNVPASATGVTAEALTRREAATHVFVALLPVRTSRAELRILAGPSFFTYTADMVEDVLYAQTFDPLTPQHTITITGFTSQETNGSSVGFHIGADFAYFFTKVFGVTGGVRFSRGTVTVDEPLSKQSQQMRVGSTLGFLGVRVRFGG